MSITTLRQTACLVALSILLSCGDDSTAPEPAVESNVSLESGNAVSGSIGAEGGSLQTTADDGTVYTLEIPEASIPTTETITMTPIVDIDGYPVAAGVAAGVELKPDGLVFTVPAILTIETAKTPGTGLVPVAITYEGDATSFAPGFVGTGVGTFTIPIEHFTGWSVGFATAFELGTIAGSGSVPCLQAAAGMVFPRDTQAAIAVFRSCFQSDVLPAINQASSDLALAKAIGKYNLWKTDGPFILLMPSFDTSSETQQAMDALVPKLQQAITANNDQCKLNESFVSTAKVLFWQKQAAHFGIDTVTHLLDLETVVRSLCLRPVVDNVQIPANLQVGFPHSLDIEFGVIFDGQTVSQAAPFHVQIQASGVNVQHPNGFTNTQGQYTTVVTATQSGPVSLTATACLVLPETTLPTPVCVIETIAGQGVGPIGVDLTGRWRFGFVSFDNPSPCGQFGGAAIVELTQNQNAVSGPWQSTGLCGIPTMSGTMTATLANATDGTFSWVELVNWRIQITSVSNPQSHMAFVPEIVASAPGRLNFSANGLVDNVAAIGHSTLPSTGPFNFIISGVARCPDPGPCF